MHAENAGRHGQHEAVAAAGEVTPLDGAVFHDEAECDGDHGEIGAADAQCRHGEKPTDDADEDNACAGCREVRPAGLFHQQHGRVGTDRHEADMPQRDLSCQSEQDIQADTGDCRKRDRRDEKYRIAVSDRGIAEDCHNGSSGKEREAGGHTFFTPARPSNP